MRSRLLTYLFLTVLGVFVIDKLAFMAYYHRLLSEAGVSNLPVVLLHGLPMDLSVCGYIMFLPCLLLFLNLFVNFESTKFLKLYFLSVSIAIALTVVPDLVLYDYWGFRLDRTALGYLQTPSLIVANVSAVTALSGLLCISLHATGMFMTARYVINRFTPTPTPPRRKLLSVIGGSIGLLVVFIMMRGGITTATMNISRVYFSDKTFLNHAAVNPVFNLVSSLQQKSNRRYHFMSDEEMRRRVANVMATTSDSVPQLLTTKRPNIVFIILESFSRFAVEPMSKEAAFTPNLQRYAKEGALFNGMYANSFRTDRGIVSILAGFPAQPAMSILKYPHKVEQLCSIHKSLKDNGYKTSFLYGGDATFARIKTLFSSHGTNDITSDKDFSVRHRLSKWGVPDHIAFDELLRQIDAETESPYLKIFLTLSSHEPFDVPTHRSDNKYLNSVAYTDSCIGVFIERLRQRPDWERTLVILTPDHKYRYPTGVEYFSPKRHDVFMLWLGGAVNKALTVSKLCSQTDIAATLLAQLGIDASGFAFSRNVLNPATPDFAFYDFPDGFGVVAAEGAAVYDCKSKSFMLRQSADLSTADSLSNCGKAWLQKVYNVIDNKSLTDF